MDKMISNLAKAVISYKECIQDLPETSFLEPIHEWSPRDVTAHLIGWNRHVITGCRQIRMGKLPDYFSDDANDYKNINHESVALYDTQDRDLLLADLENSYLSLENFLQFMERRLYFAYFTSFFISHKAHDTESIEEEDQNNEDKS